MKKLMMMILLIHGIHVIANAQALPQGGDGGCVIKYDYDAAGNRIKRDKYCWQGQPAQRPIFTDNEKGVENIDLTLYPNPASSKLMVQVSGKCREAKLELQNIQGAVLYSKTIIEEDVYTLNTQALAAGTYLIVLKPKEGKRNLTRKFVKE